MSRKSFLQHFVSCRGGEGECWEWSGSRNAYGYGIASVPRRYAHRMAYELLVGPIPAGLTIDHLCRNRACVNPAHMEAVTQRVNALRGTCPPARNARKTHCAYGHEFTPDNTHYRPSGSRACRTCTRRLQSAYKKRHREVAREECRRRRARKRASLERVA